MHVVDGSRSESHSGVSIALPGRVIFMEILKKSLFYRLFSSPRAAPPGAPYGVTRAGSSEHAPRRQAPAGWARLDFGLGFGLRLLFRISAWISDFGWISKLIWLDFGLWLDLVGFDLDFGLDLVDLAFIH